MTVIGQMKDTADLFFSGILVQSALVDEAFADGAGQQFFLALQPGTDAEQFAKDSGSALGGIRRANQGLFEILPRDRAQGISEQGQMLKVVRVVATLEYLLQ